LINYTPLFGFLSTGFVAMKQEQCTQKQKLAVLQSAEEVGIKKAAEPAEVHYTNLDQFWKERLVNSREGTSWYNVLMVLTAYRLIDPGSEWRLHRQWYEQSAMGDLLGEDLDLHAVYPTRERSAIAA
jgi:hypothetical protein